MWLPGGCGRIAGPAKERRVSRGIGDSWRSCARRTRSDDDNGHTVAAHAAYFGAPVLSPLFDVFRLDIDADEVASVRLVAAIRIVHQEDAPIGQLYPRRVAMIGPGHLVRMIGMHLNHAFALVLVWQLAV